MRNIKSTRLEIRSIAAILLFTFFMHSIELARMSLSRAVMVVEASWRQDLKKLLKLDVLVAALLSLMISFRSKLKRVGVVETSLSI